jgi:hypothetical protein
VAGAAIGGVVTTGEDGWFASATVGVTSSPVGVGVGVKIAATGAIEAAIVGLGLGIGIGIELVLSGSTGVVTPTVGVGALIVRSALSFG